MTTIGLILFGSGITFIWTAATNRDIREVVRSVISGQPIPPRGSSQAQREGRGPGGIVGSDPRSEQSGLERAARGALEGLPTIGPVVGAWNDLIGAPRPPSGPGSED